MKANKGTDGHDDGQRGGLRMERGDGREVVKGGQG